MLDHFHLKNPRFRDEEMTGWFRRALLPTLTCKRAKIWWLTWVYLRVGRVGGRLLVLGWRCVRVAVEAAGKWSASGASETTLGGGGGSATCCRRPMSAARSAPATRAPSRSLASRVIVFSQAKLNYSAADQIHSRRRRSDDAVTGVELYCVVHAYSLSAGAHSQTHLNKRPSQN
jgi:hypothetical protein